MSDHRWEQIPLEEAVALRAASARLHDEFDGEFGHDTISQLLHVSYVELSARAKVKAWMPLFAERYTREQLWAYTRGHGEERDPRPHVLFLCTHNAGRSQAAMAYFREFVGSGAVAWSGGSAPVDEINPLMVQAMAEDGVDISTAFPKKWTDAIVSAADLIVSMGCGDCLLPPPGLAVEEWDVPDPADLPLEAVRDVRDQVKARVADLADRLGVARAEAGN